MQKFNSFLKEDNATNIMPHDIEDMKQNAKWMDDRDRGRYIAALDTFWDAYNKKEMYQARFGEAYSYDLMRPLEHGYEKLRYKTNVIERLRANEFKEDSDGVGVSVASIKKELRHWTDHKANYPEVWEFFYNLRKLPEFIKELKTYLKKGREPKAPVPGQWVKPMVPDAARKLAVGYLEEVVGQVRQDYYASYYEYFTKRAIHAQDIVKENEYDVNKTRNVLKQRNDAESYGLINLLFDQISGTYANHWKYTYALKKNWKDILKKTSDKNVDMIIADFLSKNGEKLGHIFAKKVKIVEHKIVSNTVKHGVMENTMYFKFDDNSNFAIYTTTVYSYSKLGTFFVRFPTRFTNVTMADGSKMTMPSEEKMIREF